MSSLGLMKPDTEEAKYATLVFLESRETNAVSLLVGWRVWHALNPMMQS